MTDYKAEYERLAEAAQTVIDDFRLRPHKPGTDWYKTDCALNELERALNEVSK